MNKLLKVSISFILSFILSLSSYTVAFSETVSITEPLATEAGTVDLLTADTSHYDEAIKLADMKAKALTTFYGVTSIQYALINNGEIILSGQAGVSSKSANTAPTKDHMYGIGAISKIFTTVAIMQLVEQNKINLDTPVYEYIPEFTMSDPRYKDITVRMLLNHSSGLMGSTLSNTLLFEEQDLFSYNNFLNSLKTARLKADPGEFSVYCNDGFTLAELVIEKVSGISFTEYLRTYINKPLGLLNTKTPTDKFNRYRLAMTYLPGIARSLPTESVNMIGAGGIYSSASDLCYLSQIFMKQSASKILTSSSVKAMENPEYLNGMWPEESVSMLSYGLGWDNVNTYPFSEYNVKALVKGGDSALFHGSLIVLPDENMAMAVLTSGGASIYNQVMAQEVLLSALKAKGTLQEIKENKTFTKPIKIDVPKEQKKYEGVYAHFGGVMKVAINDDGILSLSSALESSIISKKYYYTWDGKFYYFDGSHYISFKEEANGNIYLYTSGYSQLPGIGQMIDSGYQAQKLTNNPISKRVKAAWDKREGKKFFIINEKYTSQVYPIGIPYITISTLKDIEGYCLNATIVDESTAKTSLQIPGMYGRDLNDYEFYTKGKSEYLKAGGRVFLSEDAITSLSLKTSFTSTINANGDAHWYRISKKSGNKKIKVTLPKNSSFIVYDKYGKCLNNSFLTKQYNVTLPADGYIVFCGNANSKFTVQYLN